MTYVQVSDKAERKILTVDEDSYEKFKRVERSAHFGGAAAYGVRRFYESDEKWGDHMVGAQRP